MQVLSNTVGITIKSVSPTECPCGQILVGGQCETLIPSQIEIATLVQKYPFWMVYNDCTGGGCTGYEGENLNACKFGSGLCTTNNTYTFTIKGTVVDSAGHPVCGVPLDYQGSLSSGMAGSIPWHTPDNLDEGVWSIGSGVSAKTDSNGEFTVSFDVNIYLTGVKGCSITTVAHQVVSSPISWTVTVTAVGYQGVAPATVVIDVDNTICEQNPV